MVNAVDDTIEVGIPQSIPGGGMARALLALAFVFLVLGLTLPLVQTTQLWLFEDEYSILQAVERLYIEDEYILAGLVGLFSIIVPCVKAFALIWLNFVRPNNASKGVMTFADMIGRYAWVEVLVIAVLITVYSAQPGLDIQTREGLWFFAASAAGFLAAASLIRRGLKSATPEIPSD